VSALASVGRGALGLSKTIARAQEHAAILERARAVGGDAHMERATRCYLWFDVTTDQAVSLAPSLAVFEWMARPGR